MLLLYPLELKFARVREGPSDCWIWWTILDLPPPPRRELSHALSDIKRETEKGNRNRRHELSPLLGRHVDATHGMEIDVTHTRSTASGHLRLTRIYASHGSTPLTDTVCLSVERKWCSNGGGGLVVQGLRFRG
jgi:hypothetical protein